MVYTGVGGEVYWGYEGTELNADLSVDKHIPFNKAESVEVPKPKYNDEEKRTFDSYVPKLVYSDELKPGEASFEGFFQDPFLLLAVFTNRTATLSGASDYILTGDFSSDSLPSLFMHYKVIDISGGGNHVERTLLGGMISSYELSGERGKPITESASLMFRNFRVESVAMNCSTNFHDQSFSATGGWANWNSAVHYTKDTSITWGGNPLSSIDILSFKLTIETNYDSINTMEALYHNRRWPGERHFSLEVSGKFSNKTLMEEFEKVYADRTKADLILYLDTTAGYEKKITITNAYVAEHDVFNIPKIGEALEGTITFRGGVDTSISFNGTYQNVPDPTDVI